MDKKTYKPKNSIYFLAAGMIFILTAIYGSEVKQAVKNALAFCAENMVPPLFPALFLTSFMTSAGIPERLKKILALPAKHIFGLPESCVEVVLMGLTAGYPAGTKAAAQLLREKKVSIEYASRAAAATVNPGLIYTVTAVGANMFGSAKIGVMLYFSVLSAQLAVAFFTKKKRSAPGKISAEYEHFRFSTALTTAVSNAANACISMSSWIAVFNVLTVFVNKISLQLIKNSWMLLSEITGAVSYSLYKNSPELCAFSLAFGGICIFCQLLPELESLGVGAGEYFFDRTLTGLLSMTVMRLLRIIFPSAVAVSLPLCQNTAVLTQTAANGLSLIFLSVIFMYAIANRFGIC